MLKRRANAKPSLTTAQPKSATTKTKAKPPVSATAPTLPALDEPAVNANEPVVSYKTHFKDHNSFYASRDGGKSSQPIGADVVAGKPINFYVLISKATNRDGNDYRFRFGFINTEGELAELNLNACNVNRNGSYYVTSPVRSLVGSLLEASQSEDDMAAIANGVRFRLEPGGRGGLFITLDAVFGDAWVSFGGATSTAQVPSEPTAFWAMLALIKSRFHGAGMLPDERVFQGVAPELLPAAD